MNNRVLKVDLKNEVDRGISEGNLEELVTFKEMTINSRERSKQATDFKKKIVEMDLDLFHTTQLNVGSGENE